MFSVCNFVRNSHAIVQLHVKFKKMNKQGVTEFFKILYHFAVSKKLLIL